MVRGPCEGSKRDEAATFGLGARTVHNMGDFRSRGFPQAEGGEWPHRGRSSRACPAPCADRWLRRNLEWSGPLGGERLRSLRRMGTFGGLHRLGGYTFVYRGEVLLHQVHV